MGDAVAAPKLFVSYSWSSPEHEDRVLKLATEMRESGIDVILDKWDLKEGHDAHAFMEKMVTDPEIGKVILVCDKEYAAKADGRSGGVGTEAQIISPEIYAKKTQEKFVAVVFERDEDGKPYLPVYYQSRIYIDLSDETRYASEFERLLRWALDKPLFIKPEIGEVPSFIADNEDVVRLGTSVQLRRAMDAIRAGRDHADAAADEYFTALAGSLESLRIAQTSDSFDDEVVKSVESFTPYRNETIELFAALSLYRDTEETRRVLHRFFERLVPFLYRPPSVTQWHDGDFDNYRFIVHELFLYALAVHLRHERFQTAAHLLGQLYYVPGASDYGTNTVAGFEVFRQHMPSLKQRNSRLKLKRLSLRADMLKSRCSGVSVGFQDLMQADFVAFLRSELQGTEDGWRWWPETLLWVGHNPGPMELFARSRSQAFFDRVRDVLGIDSVASITELLEQYKAGTRNLPRWEFDSFNPAVLLGVNELCTAP